MMPEAIVSHDLLGELLTHQLQLPYQSLDRYWARHPPSFAALLAGSGELVKKEHPGKMSKSLQ